MADMKSESGVCDAKASISLFNSKEYRKSFLASIIEGSDDAIIGKTLEGIVLSWNRGAENIYQYSEIDMVGKSIMSIVPKEKVDEVKVILENVSSGQRVDHFQTTRVRKDGVSVVVSLTVSPVINECGEIIGVSTISRDITDRVGQEEKIRQANQIISQRDRFIRLVMDNIPAMVAYWDIDMHCEYHNKKYRDMYGKTKFQMGQVTVLDLLGQALFKESEGHVHAVLRGEPQMFERTLIREDGSLVFTLARYIPDEIDGEIRGFYVFISDVTELKNTQMELERRVQELNVLATTDTLTEIDNRRSFIKKAGDEFRRSRRYNIPLSFVMIDADHFKSINDTYGHDVGDEVLKSIANALKDTMRASDHVGRLGGEEFGVIMVHADSDSARAATERLLDRLRNSCCYIVSSRVCVTISAGLCAITDDIETFDELMRRADIALLHAKRSGRDRVCSYEESWGRSPNLSGGKI